MKVLVFQPKIDEPWKQPAQPTADPPKIRLTEDALTGRLYWRDFADALGQSFAAAGHAVDVDIRPPWQITADLVNGTDADLAVIPHRTRGELPGLRIPALFYMQRMMPWQFTLDRAGWGAASSLYPCDYSTGRADNPEFDALKRRIVDANLSKFAQAARRSWLGLAAARDIPLSGGYIFFPCQIPHDQSVTLFSPVSVEAAVAALADWAQRRRIHLVLKGHPANPKSMAPLRAVAPGGRYLRWSDASVHDLTRHCAAVYTVNSGVGFEALLHGKPIVTFGRSEYDAVTVHARPDNLDAAWAAVKAWDRRTRIREYRRFIDWFCSRTAIDISDPARTRERLDASVEQVAAGILQAAVRSGADA